MRRAVFLDRDGTLIRNHHYGCDPGKIQLLDGVVEGLRQLQAEGYLLIVVTNQSGVARGFFTEDQLEAMHRRMAELLRRRGVHLSAFYHCPHHPDGVVPAYSVVCDCRKPRPGLVLRACSDFGIDPARSWLIGDILDDVEAGKRAGCRSIVREGAGIRTAGWRCRSPASRPQWRPGLGSGSNTACRGRTAARRPS